MTLAGYVDSLAELSCYNYIEDPEGILGYVERWEARQPTTAAYGPLKDVETPLQLTLATQKKYREELKEELPDIYASAKVHRQNAALSNSELKEMVAEHQEYPTPEKYANCMLSQRHLYEIWRSKLLSKGRIPSYYDFGTWTFGWLWLMFGLKEPDELAMVFGFGDLLPEERRDPERAACLMYRGFLYPCDQWFVRGERDKVMAELNHQKAQREAAKVECLAQRCAQTVANTVQATIDDIVNDAKKQIRREYFVPEPPVQDYPEEPPRYNYTKRDNRRTEQARSSTRTTYHDAYTSYTSAKASGLFASLSAAVCTLVNETVNLVGELFGGNYPGGEPK